MHCWTTAGRSQGRSVPFHMLQVTSAAYLLQVRAAAVMRADMVSEASKAVRSSSQQSVKLSRHIRASGNLDLICYSVTVA